MNAGAPLPDGPSAPAADGPLRSDDAFASQLRGLDPARSRQWNSEALRTAFLLVGKEMARHDRKSRAFSVCFAAYQQIEASDVQLGAVL